jgi:hypothetical protein
MELRSETSKMTFSVRFRVDYIGILTLKIYQLSYKKSPAIGL